MKTQMHAAEKPAPSGSLEADLDSYLDAVAGATAVFRSAVDAYLHNEPEGACWQQAKRITEHLRMADDMQQKLEMGVPADSELGALVADMVDPLTGVSHLLKDMKRQVNGFAVESGVSGPGRHVPMYLIPQVQELSDAVCAAVDALVASYRPNRLWWQQAPTGDEARGVSWYEVRADRLSMLLIKEIFADDILTIEVKLSLARFVEEIDRVADQAEGIDNDLRASRGDCLPIPGDSNTR